MNRRSTILAAAFLAALTLGLTRPAAAGATDEGFKPIFNGKDLAGWDGDPKLWSVRDGVIRGETTKENPAKHNTFLIWRGGTLGDFQLRLSFRIRTGNSGVQVRSRDRGDWIVSGYQCEVAPSQKQMGLFYDERGRARLATAGQRVTVSAAGENKISGMFGEPEAIQKAFKENAWNEFDIIGRGNRLVQKINGVAFSEVSDDHAGVATTSGILALQIHMGAPMVVEFKDVRLKSLAEEGGTALFNGKDLDGWSVKDQEDFASHGKVYAKDGVLFLEEGAPMTGIGWAGKFPTTNYEVSVEAKRISGNDFFCGMTFPIGDSWATWINGGWGGNVVGLSNVDEMNASENETSTGKSFEDNRWYHFRLRVTADKIQCWIDDEQMIDLKREGHRFAVWGEQAPIRPFGVATWHTGSALRNFKLRLVSE